MFIYLYQHFVLIFYNALLFFLDAQNKIINIKKCAGKMNSFSADSVELNVNKLADFNHSPSTDTKTFKLVNDSSFIGMFILVMYICIYVYVCFVYV